jgi:hypothetical protein
MISAALGGAVTDEITRDQLVERLGAVEYDRFLVYLMGPYKSFDLNYVLSDEERASIDIDDLPSPLRRLFQNRDAIDEAKALLRRVQGRLRTDPGVNAFLAVDADVDTDDVDAVTQSIAFTERSNATAFVVPFLGHNFGVGEEAGSVLEALSERDGERVVFVHEADVTSEMIRSARTRWDLRIERYETEAELVERLRLFVAEIMHREQFGDLEPRE